MNEDTLITEEKQPNSQKVKWKNVAYYDTFEEANNYRLGLEESVKVKVRRCGPDKIRFVVKIGTLVKAVNNE